MDNTTPAPEAYQKAIDAMGDHIYDRFLDFIRQEDVLTSKALMSEWVVDGVDPYDGDVEFIWLNQINME